VQETLNDGSEEPQSAWQQHKLSQNASLTTSWIRIPPWLGTNTGLHTFRVT